VPCHHLLSPTDIFLDIIGYLEGEAVVEECIPALPLSWSRMVHPEFRLEAVGDIRDWRDPILDLWNSPRTRIYIKIKGR
jgi:hypothetical protein